MSELHIILDLGPILSVAVARSFSSDAMSVVVDVHPVLWMTSYLHIMVCRGRCEYGVTRQRTEPWSKFDVYACVVIGVG